MASPLVEEFFFTTPAKPFVGKNCDLHGNGNEPFMTHGEKPHPKFLPEVEWLIGEFFITLPQSKFKYRTRANKGRSQLRAALE